MTLLHDFKGDPFTEYLVHLSDKLNVPIVNNAIQLPLRLGVGVIKNFLLEEGLGLRYYNFTLKRDLEFKMFSEDEQTVNYKLLYNLDEKKQVSESRNILMYSNNFQKKGFIYKGEPFCKIALIFTNKWLKNNYQEACTKITELADGLALKNVPTVISEEMDSKSYCLARELAAGLSLQGFPPIHIKMGCVTLLNDFLNRVVEREKNDVFSDQSLHYDTITQVEARLMSCLQVSLPCQEALAKEFNISLSTLKRHFRIVFGKNIYEYYQEKRMLWGKAEIEKGHSNINEIATKLGFIKVNNFSKAFKKQFDILPREIKHKNFLMNGC
ncbi:MAG: AraC family transcriptional regulator [Ferruginibacter sp.]